MASMRCGVMLAHRRAGSGSGALRVARAAPGTRLQQRRGVATEEQLAAISRTRNIGISAHIDSGASPIVSLRWYSYITNAPRDPPIPPLPSCYKPFVRVAHCGAPSGGAPKPRCRNASGTPWVYIGTPGCCSGALCGVHLSTSCNVRPERLGRIQVGILVRNAPRR